MRKLNAGLAISLSVSFIIPAKQPTSRITLLLSPNRIYAAEHFKKIGLTL